MLNEMWRIEVALSHATPEALIQKYHAYSVPLVQPIPNAPKFAA